MGGTFAEIIAVPAAPPPLDSRFRGNDGRVRGNDDRRQNGPVFSFIGYALHFGFDQSEVFLGE